MAKKDNNPKQAPCNNCSKTTCKKENQPAQQDLQRLLLVGNSPNLVERQNGRVAWDRLMRTLERSCMNYIPIDKVAKSFPQRMQEICNVRKMLKKLGGGECLEEAFQEWLNEVRDMLPTAIHRMLAKMDFDHYLTTNYDHALERAICSDFKVKGAVKISEDVWAGWEKSQSGMYKRLTEIPANKGKKDVIHIHGMVSGESPLVMSPGSYAYAASVLKKTKAGKTWLDLFVKSEIHICGIDLRPEELVIWRALELRYQKLCKEGRYDKSDPRAYAYVFYKEDDEKQQREMEQLRHLLMSYGVILQNIPVHNNNYEEAWGLLIGKMELNINKYRIKNGNSDNLDDDELNTVLYLERAGKNRGKNLSTAFVQHYMFPYFCRMSISEEKCKAIEKTGYWLCYCVIEGNTYMWWFNGNDITKFLDFSKEEKAELLLDYRHGAVYKIDRNTKDRESLLHLAQGGWICDLSTFSDLLKLNED